MHAVRTTTCAPVSSAPDHPASDSTKVSSELGSTLIEFALVLPIALLLVFGMLQVTLLLLSYCNMAYACSVAVRYASLHSAAAPAPATSSSIESAVRPLLWTAPTNATVTTDWSPSNTVGAIVTVSVRETLPFSIPFTNLQQFTIGSTTQRLVLR